MSIHPMALVAGMLGAGAAAAQEAGVLRAGIIGCDTSHVIAFTNLINDPKATGELAKVEVVAAYPGGSPDIPASKDRVEGYTKTLRERGIEIVDSIPALLEKVDAVLIESVDGRPHLDQARPVIGARKPLFIDKPIAGSLADAVAIFELARQAGVPCFSSSSLRFYPGVQAVQSDPKIGPVLGCDAYGPCSLEEHHPDLFWYGIHGVETLFAIMGTGCQSVSRLQAQDFELAAGVWSDGRIGTFRGLRAGRASYGATVFGSKAIAPADMKGGSYLPLVEQICLFFRTGQAPVSAEATIEIIAFMEAADESKRQGGRPVTIESVLAKARAQAAARRAEP